MFSQLLIGDGDGDGDGDGMMEGIALVYPKINYLVVHVREAP